MKFDTEYTSYWTVELDENKFTKDFMAEFRESFYPFYALEDHAEHITQLYARGVVEGDEFIEGYGKPSEAGIKVTLIVTDSFATINRDSR